MLTSEMWSRKQRAGGDEFEGELRNPVVWARDEKKKLGEPREHGDEGFEVTSLETSSETRGNLGVSRSKEAGYRPDTIRRLRVDEIQRERLQNESNAFESDQVVYALYTNGEGD